MARGLGDTQRQYSQAVAVIDGCFQAFEMPELRVLNTTHRRLDV
jgi:hypothetical protein